MNERPSRLADLVPEYVGGSPPKYGRAVLRYFDEHSDDAADIDDLTAFVCRCGDEATSESRVEIRLHHSTLPKLADAGVLDYDPRSYTARYRGSPDVDV